MIALGTHLINPYGRRFRVVRMVPEQDLVQLERQDRRIREQLLVWRGLAEAERWTVAPPPMPRCSACNSAVPEGTGTIAEHRLLCRPCVEAL